MYIVSFRIVVPNKHLAFFQQIVQCLFIIVRCLVDAYEFVVVALLFKIHIAFASYVTRGHNVSGWAPFGVKYGADV